MTEPKPPTPAAQRLGAWLKARRGELKRSLREAAELGKCSDPWLCQLESGYASLASVRADSLPKVAAAYSLSVVDLLKKMKLLTSAEETST